MKYLYKIFQPLDYLRLLYAVFFDRRKLSTNNEPKQLIITVIQALLLILSLSLIVELSVQYSNGKFSWLRILVNITVSLIFGLGFGIISLIIDDLEKGAKVNINKSVLTAVEKGVMSGLVFTTIYAFMGSVAALVSAISITVFDLIKSIEKSIATSVVYTVMNCAMFGIFFSVIEARIISKSTLAVGATGVIFAVLAAGFLPLTSLRIKQLIANIIFIFLFLSLSIFMSAGIRIGALSTNTSTLNIPESEIWIEIINSGGIVIGTFLITGIANVLSEKISRSPSIKIDLWLGIVMLALLSVAIGYLFRLLDHFFGLSSPDPLILAALVIIFSTRLFLWPLEAIWALLIIWWSGKVSIGVEALVNILNRAYFDRQMFLPLPGERSLLYRLARVDYNRALDEAINLATESGHRFASVSLLHRFACTEPLFVQDYILGSSQKYGIDSCKQLLGYVAYRLPVASAYAWEGRLEIIELCVELVFRSYLKDQQPPPQLPPTKDISLSEVVDRLRQAVFKLESAREIAPRMNSLEMYIALYSTLLQALEAENIDTISSFTNLTSPANFVPDLAIALTQLSSISEKLREYQATTSPVRQRDFLLQVNEQVEELANELKLRKKIPFQPLISLIIEHWRQVIVAEGGELARAKLATPVNNPYVVANPVRGDLFIGRDDIMFRLKELWTNKKQCPSVLLYGHRRMGKSSILQNLGNYFDSATIVVNFNMENYGWAQNNGELLFNLALQLYDAWYDSGHNELLEPDEELFLNKNPYMAFNRFLANLNRLVNNERFIITVDEFEIIEDGIKEGRLDSDLLRYWRGTFQNYPWFIMAFAGLYTLEEMCRDYWNPMYSSARLIPVSFLTPQAARKLITSPTDDFSFDYEQEAVKLIIQLTNGQPFLIQLICHTLVEQFNRQLQEAIKQEPYFTLNQVHSIIETPEFYVMGNAYFNGIWIQAESNPSDQHTILKVLSKANLSLSEIADETDLNLEQVKIALETLQRHDVIVQRDKKYFYTVELMRRWVEREKCSL